MGDKLKGAIEDLLSELETKMQEVAELKRVINSLRRRIGEEPTFPDESPEGVGNRRIVRDQFYGRPLVTVVRELLEMRGALTPDEIVKGLSEGDYKFEWRPELRAKNVSISLGKNMDFVRLPSGTWGLRSKYPNATKSQRKKPAAVEKKVRKRRRRKKTAKPGRTDAAAGGAGGDEQQVREARQSARSS